MKYADLISPIMMLLLAFASPAGAQQSSQSVAAEAQGDNSDTAETRRSEANDGERDADQQDKQIYRVQQPDGSVNFTDDPPDPQQAEEVDVNAGEGVSLEDVEPGQPLNQSKREDSTPEYQLRIDNPVQGKTFRNPTQPIPVNVRVQPGLRAGHELRILYDGDPLSGNTIDNPFRGTHTLQAKVVDKDGKVLEKTNSREIYVHQPSRQLP